MPMPFVRINGLKEEGRRGLVWLLLGATLTAISPPVWWVVLVVITLGIAVASVDVSLFSRGQMDPNKWLSLAYVAVVVGLVFSTSASGQWNELNAFGLGSIAFGTRRIVPWLFKKRITAALYERVGFPVHTLQEPRERMEQSDALRALMREFPDPIWEPILTGMTETAMFVRARRARVRSRLGGRPDLPAGFIIPMHGEIPLTYLAQVDLAEFASAFPASPLPKHGRLLFFYNQQDSPWGHEDNDRGSGAIFHLEKPSDGIPTALGSSVIPVSFEVVPVPEIDDQVEDRMYELRRTLSGDAQKRFDVLINSGTEALEVSRLLGYPATIQGNMTSELCAASRSYGLPEESEWRLVLQLDSEEELGWCWGDAGLLYFWVPAEDLAAARFDRCWVVLQCT